jgi:hypothetical protein
MSKIELSIRTATLIITIIAPFACIATYGWEYSYSQYWNTPLQPLFILSNIITAYYLFDSERWKIPAVFLTLLVGFSVEDYLSIHNLMAVSFFLACVGPLWLTNHFKWILWPYLVCIVIVFYDLLLAEILAMGCLVLFHGLMLYKYKRLNKQKQINNEQNER